MEQETHNNCLRHPIVNLYKCVVHLWTTFWNNDKINLFTIFTWLIKINICVFVCSKNIKTIFDFCPSIGQHFSVIVKNAFFWISAFSTFTLRMIYLTSTRRKKSIALIAREQGNQLTSCVGPCQRLENVLSRKCLVLENENGGDPYCWKITHSWEN